MCLQTADIVPRAAGFQPIDLPNLHFPAKMYIDYVRVYQRDDAPGVGCSPDDYPTEDYINKCGPLLFYFDSRALTKRQPSERLYEPQSYNVEPSWVLFPAQLVVQRLLGSHAVPFGLVRHSACCFPMNDRYAQIFTPSPRGPSCRSRCNSTSPPIFPIIHHDYTDGFRHPRYPRDPAHHCMAHPPHVSTFKHAHRSPIRDTATLL